MASIIELKNITKRFEEKVVLNDVCLDIEEGDYISVIGASGAGKSTLMNIIGALDNQYDGEYFYRGHLLKRREMDRYRNEKLGFIFQQFNLIPTLSAYDNVMLPYVYSALDNQKIEEECEELFVRFNLYNQKNQIVNTLSGGEKQRIALIRSIIMKPEIILADEPTGNLDMDNARLIRSFLRQMNEEGKTVIVVTHDNAFANEAKRKLRISGGKIIEDEIVYPLI